MNKVHQRVVKFCDWMNINRPREMLLRTIFLGFILWVTLCLGVFMLALIMTVFAGITQNFAGLSRGMFLLAIGYVA